MLTLTTRRSVEHISGSLRSFYVRSDLLSKHSLKIHIQLKYIAEEGGRDAHSYSKPVASATQYTSISDSLSAVTFL